MADHILKRILLVEDEPDIRTVACMALKNVGGFTVEMCSSGAEALQRAPVFGPDLVMLDVMMPGMDGLSTYRKLREIPQLSTTAVIFMTAKVQPQEMAKYREIGAAGVVSKPFDPMTLAAVVTNIWQQEAEKPAKSGDTLQARLDELAIDYQQGLAEKIQQIETLWKMYSGVSYEAEVVKKLHLLAHNMAGSAATFHMPRLTQDARRLEHMLDAMMQNQLPPTADERTQIAALLEILKSYAEPKER